MKERDEKSIHIVLGSTSRQRPEAAPEANFRSLNQLRDEILKESYRIPPAALSHSVLTVVNAIWQRLCEPDLNVKTLKQECRIHDNNISSAFKREMGQPIKAYIEWKRLEVAIGLLERSNHTVVDIGYIVGYEHIETFYRAFIRHLRCSPGVYRSRNRRMREANALHAPKTKAIG